MTASIEVVSFAGWARNVRLCNDTAEAIVTLEVGPRILHYGPRGGPNLLKTVEAELGKSGEPGWVMRGGHRLWISPEDPVRTYVPDNGPVTHRIERNSVEVTTPADAVTGLERTMTLTLADRGPRLSVVHKVTNKGGSPVHISVWALTVFPPKGLALIPLPASRPHPGDSAKATAADFAPQFTLALWPYFRFGDPRFSFGERFIRIQQDSALLPAKIGLRLTEGWAGYLRDGLLFVKSVPDDKTGWPNGATFPDGGCNFESYTDSGILELETLGPLVTLAPGARAEHVETWAFLDGITSSTRDADLLQALMPRVRSALGQPG